MKELSNLFVFKSNEAINNVRSIINGYGYQYEINIHKGICVISTFRGEYDYSFIVPWEYCEDCGKIKDFYNRLEEYTKDSGSIPEKDDLCQKFTDFEFEKLKRY
jgi:hypothetical protein